MSQPSTDRNLLFGILALQMDFISRDALIKAMHAWVLDKAHSLGDILVEQKALGTERHALLEALVQEHLKQHGNNAEQSLAAVSSVGSVRQELQLIADPDLQASLAAVSKARQADDDSWATGSGAVGTPTSSGQRFRILRPHAKGGLGQVSVAHDEELHREVALKEIQERHADDHDSRARFVREAEITGGLEHPGIVPVYGLGCYADGRPYYAMRFIRGDSLKDAIERFHQAEGSQRDSGERILRLRELLGRFVDVCNAVAYAHSRGVLHRDLKPGNIMLGPYGETLVVDWGLAKPVDRPELASGQEGRLMPSTGSASAPTQMGSAVGTPEYMSPEQAAGRLDQLGPATDVYSLGATLYCLLTSQPAFARSEAGDILARVQQGLFPAPRQVKKSVPSPLEAVCLKAMATQPQQRYASVHGLVKDIEHWLADEPVTAYPEPAPVRMGRWMRRHRTLVSSLAVLLVTAVVALTVSVIMLGREQAQTEKQRQLAVTEKDRADANAADASDQRGLAMQTLKDVIFDIQAGLKTTPAMQELRKKLLDKAQKGLEKVARRAETSAQVDHGMAWVHFELGDIFLLLAETGNAQQHYEEGNRIAAALVKADPNDVQAQRDLSVSYVNLGEVKMRLGDTKATLENYRQSLEIRKALAEADPKDARAQRDLSVSYNALGEVLLQQGDSRAALDSFSKSLKIAEALTKADPMNAEAKYDLSTFYGRMAYAQLDVGDTKAALEYYRKNVEIAEALAKADPKNARAQRHLSVSYINYGNVQLDQGDAKAAMETIDNGLKIAEALAKADPKDARVQRDLVFFYEGMGDVQLRLGNTKAALANFGKSLAVAEALAKADPMDAQAQRDLGGPYLKVGDVQLRLGDTKAALENYHKLLEISEALAKADPKDARGQNNLLVSYLKLGDVQLSLGETKAALDSFRKMLEISEALAKADPKNPRTQSDLSFNYNKLAWLLVTCSDQTPRNPAQAVTMAKKAVAQSPQKGGYHNTLGVCYYRAGNWKDAIATLEKSMKLDKANTSCDCFFLAMAYHQLGNKEQANGYFNQAVQWMDKNKANDPELRRFRAEAAALLGIAETPKRKGDAA